VSNASFLQLLTDASTVPVVALHNFLLNVKSNEKTIHSFFEGKTDESFYGTIIRRIKDENYKLKTYICGNKDSVYYQHEKLNSRKLKNQMLLFFVDKDIEDIIPYERPLSDNIYVTDYYSIENYIVNDQILEQVWAEIFKQTSGHELSSALCDKFNRALSDYHRFMIIVMSWILYHRRNLQNDHDATLNLDCVKLKRMYEINEHLEFKARLGHIDDVINMLDLQTKNKTYFFIWNGYKQILCKELVQYDRKCIVRGHFEMEFFVYFISSLRKVVEKTTAKQLKVSVEINDANAVDVLGPRVMLPPSLELFLQKWLQPQLVLDV